MQKFVTYTANPHRMAEILLSEAERIFILHGIQDNLRTDGRGCEDYRCIQLETDVVSTTNGSAHLRLSNTDILVGVKAEISSPSQQRSNEGRLEFFVDCSANATPEFEGRGGEDLATSISTTLQQAFNHKECLDLKALCLVPGQHCFVLNVDVLVLECGGNLYDAVSLAVKAALFNTKIPNVTVAPAESGQVELDLSDDPYDCTRLSVEGVPAIVTLNKIGHHHVVDATMHEEACTLARLLVGVTDSGTVSLVKKDGGGSLDPESIVDMIECGKRVGVSLNKCLMTRLKEEEKMGRKRKKVGFMG